MHKIQFDIKPPQKQPNIKSSKIRWVILFLACIVLMGDAFSFDNPQSLETQLEALFDINQVEFNFLYAVYSIPNIILPLFGGYLIDHCGVRINILIFSTLLVLGQIIFTISVSKKLFWLAVVGRLIFGIGSECLTISQTSLVSYWFGYQELSLAVGLNLSVPRLGGALNSYLIPKIYEINHSLDEPMIFSTFLCFFCSFVGGLVLIMVDQRNRPSIQKDKTPETPPQKESSIQNSMRSVKMIQPFENILEIYPKYGISEINLEEQTDKQSKINLEEELQLKRINQKNEQILYQVGSVLSLDQMKPNNKFLTQEIKQQPQTNNQIEEKLLLNQILKMPRIFWLLVVISSLAESLFVPFLNNANKLYQYRFGFSNVGAGEILMIPYLAACLFTPFLGIFMSINRNSPRAKYILLSSVFFLATHLFFALLPNCFECVASIVPLIMLGLCFAMFAGIIMPSVPIFVNDEKVLGTAFGLAAISQNILLTIFPLISASVFESISQQSTKDNGFMYVSALFVGASALLVAVSMILYFNRHQEKRNKIKMMQINSSQSQRANYDKVQDQKRMNSLPDNINDYEKQQLSVQIENYRDSSFSKKDIQNLQCVFE